MLARSIILIIPSILIIFHVASGLSGSVAPCHCPRNLNSARPSLPSSLSLLYDVAYQLYICIILYTFHECSVVCQRLCSYFCFPLFAPFVTLVPSKCCLFHRQSKCKVVLFPPSARKAHRHRSDTTAGFSPPPHLPLSLSLLLSRAPF